MANQYGMDTWWRIELFNGLTARSGEVNLTRFYSQKVGHLLAYVALHSRIAHAREELADLFWPDSEPEAARLNLRVGLASLRRQLEPPGLPRGLILIATRDTIRLNPERVSTDVSEFIAAVGFADNASDDIERISWLERADEVAQGELLPGCYSEWAIAERRRLADMRVGVLRRLMMDREQRGILTSAIDFAHRMLAFDTLNEESHCHLIRLYSADGQAAAARRQYNELENILQNEFGESPSEEAQLLLKRSPTPRSVRTIVSLSSVARHGLADAVTAASDKALQKTYAKQTAVHTLPALPRLFSRFFGRDTELDELERLLAPSNAVGTRHLRSPRSPQSNENLAQLGTRSSRIVTLTGPGGTGKTRLAVEAGHRLDSAYHGAVYFVSLLDVTAPAKIIDAILASLPSARTAEYDAFDQAANILSQEPALLILDNFEQLLSDEIKAAQSAGVVVRLRERCHELSYLLTSRQRLNIEGEHELALDPLPTPQHAGLPERLMEFAGVQLFVDRAQVSRADFQITTRNAAAIASLCGRLEGLPLALELAASWARILSPSQMLERISDRFELLVSRRRDIPARHRTLRAAIDWSFQLLAPNLQHCFMRLSVFRGGWSIDAAEAVCGGHDIVSYLTSLSECSMIVSRVLDETCESSEHQFTGPQYGTRFSMLESLREYALEQMSEDQQNDAKLAHAAYFAELAARASPHFHTADAPKWMNLLEQERENLIAALDYSFSHRHFNLGVDMAIHLDWFWFTRGYREERNLRAAQVNQCLEALGDIRPKAMLWSAHFLPPADAQSRYEHCLQLFQQRQDPAGVADSQYCLGSAAVDKRNFEEAVRQFTLSMVGHRLIGNRIALNATRAALAHVYRELGDIDQAKALLQEQLASQLSEGDVDGAAKVRVALANIALHQGDYALSESLVRMSLATYRAIGQRWGIADSLRNLGIVRCAVGDYDAGEEMLSQSTEKFREIEDFRMAELLLIDRAEHALERLDYLRAAHLISECRQIMNLSEANDDRVRLCILRGVLALEDGLEIAAAPYFEEAESCLHTAGNCIAAVWRQFRLASFHLFQQDFARARCALQDALNGAMQMGLKPDQLRIVARICELIAASGKRDEADFLLNSVFSLSVSLDITPSPSETQYRNKLRMQVSDICPTGMLGSKWNTTSGMDLTELCENALVALKDSGS